MPVCFHLQVHNLTVDDDNYAHTVSVAIHAVNAMCSCNGYDACKQPYAHFHQQNCCGASWGTTKQRNGLQQACRSTIDTRYSRQ